MRDKWNKKLEKQIKNCEKPAEFETLIETFTHAFFLFFLQPTISAAEIELPLVPASAKCTLNGFVNDDNCRMCWQLTI